MLIGPKMKPQQDVKCHTAISVTDTDVNEEKGRIGTGDPWTDLQK